MGIKTVCLYPRHSWPFHLPVSRDLTQFTRSDEMCSVFNVMHILKITFQFYLLCNSFYSDVVVCISDHVVYQRSYKTI